MRAVGVTARLQRIPRRTWLIGAAIAIVVTVGLSVLWPRPAPEPPRARQYLDVNLCLLTAERGLADPAAAPVWAGMQQVSTATRVRVQYLAVAGPQTVPNARTFLASLAQSRCSVVVAAGPVPVDAVHDAAPTFPSIRFVTIGGTPAPNVTTVDSGPAADVQKAVVAVLTPLAATAG